MDGYDYLGASFNCESLMRDINDISYYKIRFVNDISFIDDVLLRSTKTKEIYQFYVNEPFITMKINKLRLLKSKLNH